MSARVSLYARATGYEHKAVKIFLREKDTAPVIVPYTERYAPDTQAMKLWLLNRRRDIFKDRQEVAVTDPLASLSPEQRLAQVVEIMAKARALLDATPDDVTDAEYEEVEEA
jgi:hypothetical protein